MEVRVLLDASAQHAGRTDSPIATRLEAASFGGDPVHVTEWDLRRTPRFTPAPGTRVLVCENPRVIEGLAERDIDGWAAVCTSGETNLVVDKVRGTF